MEDNILFSCEKKKKFTSEQVVLEHTLSYVVSGKVELHFANKKVVAQKGNVALIRKNELVKAIKYPDENGLPCKSINIFLAQDVLRAYAKLNKIEQQEKYFGTSLIDLTGDKFLKSYIESLLPYIDEPNKFSSKLAQIKTMEAIELLLTKSTMKQFLFDLSEPYKIDLEKFINQNFLFNISMSEFAKLSGRSLSTFKRDFKQVYNDTPGRWLRNRRLEEAKYLITEKQLKPVDVYYSVGFENFSHFSNAFKLRFGFNASTLAI
ncbi:hypothetical protein BZG01_20560 [Labilibaculum manganireducens]|uniref:HTH araC/xylS-type domain-containing protein n=1 Tax=Labilibaculum manganireducens TaxID=1940525 RepID=A0A2N3HRN1_9BACT|nr:AraC family transcriptional regulator [Labilibaculum manganireducens]PKQ60731.1 hypothetical protein BZG01_20560 [Labilibaculum manganireducens]